MSFTTDDVTNAAKRVMIEQPKFLKMGKPDAPSDVNGRNLDIEILCAMPGQLGAHWRQVRHFVAMNCPGLFERSPSPDNTLRRGREVREALQKNGQVQPALTQ